MPTVEDLLTRGYFHDRVIPPLGSEALAPAIPELRGYVRAQQRRKRRSRCAHHSVPKKKHLRRVLSIPNPFHQTLLCAEIERNWPQLQSFCAGSQISLSVPQDSAKRALQSNHDISAVTTERALRSIGKRYLLKADFARYYPSIYTHSIPWALHGKQNSRVDQSLFGNAIDRRVRDTQDQQTGGIPIGPDTSFLLGEVIGSAIDRDLHGVIGDLHGVRFIDDVYLYFETLQEAELALSQLHKIAKNFELEIHDQKTEINALPDELEPAWKTELRAMEIRASGQAQNTDLVSLFNKAFELTRRFPGDSILTYVAKQVKNIEIDPENWSLAQALLLKATLAEPSMMSVVFDILDKNRHLLTNKEPLEATVASLCAYHAPLQQGYEVAWALWIARSHSITIPDRVIDKITQLEDDIVALVALDLWQQGCIDILADFSRWRALLLPENLYTEHWLLAYEAPERGWLPTQNGDDYVSSDGLFSILRKHNVRFYRPATEGLPPSATGYEDTDLPIAEPSVGETQPESTLESIQNTDVGNGDPLSSSYPTSQP